MKHLIILISLFITTAIYSQSAEDSIKSNLPAESIMIMKVDSVQIERINNIEKNLSAFYTYNRRYHSLVYLSVGMSLAGILIANGQSDNRIAGVTMIAGGVVSLIGTVIYLDSYKFLNFKPKRKEFKSMTYY